jgi:CBS domain-containing protein|tara:strand:+ start:1219 stop:1572 length:354 start_codon:yes stop_codon:yes gene_type:complete
MTDKDVGALVVTDNEKCIGIVTERDLVRKVLTYRLDAALVALSDVFSRPLITTSPDEDLKKAAMKMAVKMIRRLPVLEGEKLAGMLTATDLAKSLVKDDISKNPLHYAIARYHTSGY